MAEWWRSSRSAPTGAGSRGGTYHIPEERRAYHRAWRAAHPEYRERERRRRAQERARYDPAGIGPLEPFPRPLPSPAVACLCPDCRCHNETVAICGFCRDGFHQEVV